MLAVKILCRLFFRRDISSVVGVFALKPEPVQPQPVTPQRKSYDVYRSRLLSAAVLVLAFAASASAGGFFNAYDGFTKLNKRISGGDGIDIANGVITASGVSASFAAYTTAGGGRITNTTFAAYTSGAAPRLALADTALQPGDVDNEVYTSDYNGGVLSHVAINQAITDIGSAVKTLVVTPGTYPMSNHVTVPANITLRVQPGAIIDHTAGVLTINGPLDAPGQMWLDNFEYPNLVFGKMVGQVYVDWVDAAGDGATADQVPLRAILEASAYKHVHFNGSKTYNLTAALTAGYPTAIKLHGNGATIKCAVSDATSLTVGGWAASYTGQSIAITKGSSTFAIPGGVTLAAGDMIRLTAGSEYVAGYKRGVLTNVIGVSGSTAIIDILSVSDFTATDLIVFTRTDDVEVEGFVFDNTGSTRDTSGLMVQGRNAWIHHNVAKGSEAAAIGLQFLGIGGKLEWNRTQDYLSKYTTGTGRYGDGIGVSGHNIDVANNTIANSKHGITASVREFATNVTTIRNNTLSQDPARWGETFVQGGNTKTLYSGVIDVHGDAENVVIENNQIDGAGIALLTIRNGRAVVRGNRGRYWNNAAAGSGIIMIGEESLKSLTLEANDFEAESASTPLMIAADGSWLHQIAVASPVYETGIDVNVKQDGTNVLTNITNTTAYPTLAGATPSTPCQNNQLWVDSDATTGNRVYACESGTWVLQGDGDTTDHAALSNLSYAAAGHTGFEPTITAGTTAQYLRGDKSLATLNQAAVAGLTTTSSPTFTAATLSASDTSGTYLTIENTSSTSAKFMNMKMANYGGTVGGFPSYRSLNARGTKGSPTATLANDATLTFLAYGYGATGEKTSGSFKFNPEGNFSDADQPTAFIVELGKVGGSSALTERLKIETAGAISIPANGSATGGTDRLKLWNVEGDYLHIMDEDSNEARLGQKTLSLGAASGGTATIESTSHATKGLLTIANDTAVTGQITASKSVTETPKANGTCSTSIDLDADYGVHTLTLSGACAIGVTNLTAGESFTVRLTQSSTTAPTFTSAFKWTAGTAPTWSTSATKYDDLSCVSYDGTTLSCGALVDVR